MHYSIMPLVLFAQLRFVVPGIFMRRRREENSCAQPALSLQSALLNARVGIFYFLCT